MIPDVGSPAPDFELTWKVGDPPVKRSTHQDGEPLVILFFPLAFSPVCTAELCAVGEEWSAWASLDAKMVAVSVDSPWVNVRFAEETGVPFPVLSDFNKEVARAYGVLNQDYFGMRGVADRAAFVVAADGTVAYAWHTPDDSVLPDFDEVRRTVEALKNRDG